MLERLGSGIHGIVFAVENQNTGKQSAIKIHEHERFFKRERDVYRHLAEMGVTSVVHCDIPELLRCDDELWVIEMGIVTPPFVLDFAGAYLHHPPDFSDEVIAEWHAEKIEQFGDRWPEVLRILGRLESHGVYFVDVSPSNICLSD